MLITYYLCDKLIMHGNKRYQLRVFTHKLSIFHKLSMNYLFPLSTICSFCRKHSQFFLRLPLYMLRIIYLQVVILLILCTVIALHIYIVVILYMCNPLVRHLLVLLLLISIIIDIVIYRL